MTPKALEWLDTLTEPARVGANSSLGTLLKDCERLNDTKAAQRAASVDASPVGEMKAAIDQRNADRRELALQRTVFQGAKARYDAALKEYAEVEAAAQPPSAERITCRQDDLR